MTAREIDQARQALGLSVKQFAGLLDTDEQSVRRWKMPDQAKTKRAVPPRVARLAQAYLSGYRPPDWPK